MKKVFKAAIFSLSALALPLALSATARADALIKDSIDTTLEYQVNAGGDSMRFISTMVLNDSKTLNDITKIDMDFKLTKSGQDDKDSVTKTTTKVYESISGANGKAKVDNTYYAVLTITDLTTFEGWRITPTFTYTYADNSTEEVSASTWLIGGVRQYFVQQNTDWGTDLYYYMFKSETEHNASFPGEKMGLYDADNHIYYFDYLPSDEWTTVIFSNGGYEGHSQTNNMPVSSTYDYYVQQDANAFAHPTAGHDGIHGHDANKHWTCSTCKYDEEPHTLTGTTDGNIRTVSCSYCDYSVSFDTNYVYFTNAGGWTSVKVHRWGGTGESVAWPGVDATKVGVNEIGQEVYKVYVAGYTSILFHNNSGWQTVDITLSSLGNYNAVYLDYGNNDDQGHTYVGMYLYIPE